MLRFQKLYVPGLYTRFKKNVFASEHILIAVCRICSCPYVCMGVGWFGPGGGCDFQESGTPFG